MKKFVLGIILLSVIFTAVGCKNNSKTETPPPEPTMERVMTQTGPYNEAKEAYVIDVSRMTPSEKALITAMQGIINRDGAYVYVTAGSSVVWNDLRNYSYNTVKGAFTDELMEKYPYTDLFWIDYYTDKHGYTFIESTPEEVYNKFKDKFKGILYYDSVNGNYALPEIVLTVAGLTDSIPVTENLLNRKYGFLKDSEIVVDIRGKFKDKYEAHQWTIDNYLDQCNKNILGSYFNEGEGGTLQSDIAVQNKAFIVKMSFATRRFSQPEVDPYKPQDEAIMDQILKHMNPYAICWGWGEGGEGSIVTRLCEEGMILMCGNTDNASFHYKVKPLKEGFSQKAKTNPDDVKLENKIYIAYMNNEGDTYKSLSTLMNTGTWLQDTRGSLPVNWGIDPLLNELMPAMMEYYYDTATENDYFFNATSGYGYTNVEKFNSSYIDGLARLIKEGSRLADTEYLDCWYFRGLAGNDKATDPAYKWEWLKNAGMKGVTLQAAGGVQEITFESDMPAIASDMYYCFTEMNLGSVEKEVDRLVDIILANHNNIKDQPWFTFLYAGDPALFKAVMDKLPSDRYEAVPLDKLFMLAEQAKGQVAGKQIQGVTVWKNIK